MPNFTVNAYSNTCGKVYSYETNKLWDATQVAEQYLGYRMVDKVEIIHN